jgi:hypothetical protein
VELLVRPEHVQLCNTSHGTPVQVVHASFRGTRRLYTLRLPSGATFCALFPSEVTLHSGEVVRVTWQPVDLVGVSTARYTSDTGRLNTTCVLYRPRATTIAHDLALRRATMHSTTRRGCSWIRRITCLSVGGLLFLGGYLTALWTPLSIGALTVPAQAAESHQGHGQKAPARSQDTRGRSGAFHDP